MTAPPIYPDDWTPYGSIKLTEGDALSITFPGSPDLNTTQRIRRDGKIDLKTVGEVTAAGKTPAELEKEILKLYEKDLVLKEVSVILQSSSYPVFVTGAVMHPGKLLAERPISALEAIMEAGGPDNAKANLRRVVVLRNEEGHLQRYVLDLKSVLNGRSKQVFYLRPSDIVYIPEKIF
jgi:polysaccharide export outer membrane protein